MNTVLLIGGYGGFGARLCRRLANDGWKVVVAGRDLSRAQAFARELPNAIASRIDRMDDLGPALTELRPKLVVDAAGPFQDSDYGIPRACIAHGVDYLDLADARRFVCGIRSLDDAARQAGVVVISGASSVPALSGAVVRELMQDLDRVEKVEIAISASDRAAAGTSVAFAVLSYVGQPVAVWQGKRWISSPGWQKIATTHLEAHGAERFHRRVALADVPDLDILPQELPGRPATLFHAGPEFSYQLWALWLLSWPVRWGWLASLRPLAPLMRPLQSITRLLSDGRSAMIVELHGRRDQTCVRRRWELLAIDGHGPEIPVIAAHLLAQKLADGGVSAGARPSHAALSLDDFAEEFDKLAIRRETVDEVMQPLYRRVLKSNFDALPLPIRQLHDLCGDAGANGSATVERGAGYLGWLIGWIMRFPPAGQHDLHVAFSTHDGRETWLRDFGGHRFQSELSERNGRLSERFGPLRFEFELPMSALGLRMDLVRWTALGIRLPRMLAPRIRAEEIVLDGRFAFDVAIELPLVGRVVRYRGTLEPCEVDPA